MKSSQLLGMAAMFSAIAESAGTRYGLSRGYVSYNNTKLTPKQAKARNRAKAAKKSRKINRKKR